MLGVLTHGELDNGRGKCRLKLFRHQHEAETGRTSSVSHNILGFDSKGEVVNRPGHDGSLDWTQICTEAAKVCDCCNVCVREGGGGGGRGSGCEDLRVRPRTCLNVRVGEIVCVCEGRCVSINSECL